MVVRKRSTLLKTWALTHGIDGRQKKRGARESCTGVSSVDPCSQPTDPQDEAGRGRSDAKSRTGNELDGRVSGWAVHRLQECPLMTLKQCDVSGEENCA